MDICQRESSFDGQHAKVNGHRGFTYQVDVSDNGEPGTNDTFSIRLSNGGVEIYSASGKLEGGNIQLHKRHSCEGDGGDDDDDNEKED